MAYGTTLTLKDIVSSPEWMSSDTYARLYCCDWYRDTHDERKLAHHYNMKYERPARTYRAARRNKQRKPKHNKNLH